MGTVGPTPLGSFENLKLGTSGTVTPSRFVQGLAQETQSHRAL